MRLRAASGQVPPQSLDPFWPGHYIMAKKRDRILHDGPESVRVWVSTHGSKGALMKQFWITFFYEYGMNLDEVLVCVKSPSPSRLT